MKLSNEDIKRLEEFMTEEGIQTVGYLISRHKRLKTFAKTINEEINTLDRYGDIE